MRILIVDDELPARRRLRRLLEEIGGDEVAGEAANGIEALQKIQELRPDLVLLDIQMPELGGLDLVRELSGPETPMVVFVTSYDQYALQAFEVSAVDYLLKPVARERLEKALAKCRQMRQSTAAEAIARLSAALAAQPRPPLERVVGHRAGKVLLLSIDTVQAFVADDELVFAITAAGRVLVNQTLRDLEARLDGRRFVRVHKQAIVNLDHVAELEPITKGGASARLACGTVVQISRRYAVALRERLGW